MDTPWAWEPCFPFSVRNEKRHGEVDRRNEILKYPLHHFNWLKDGMPQAPHVMAEELGILLERIV